MSCGGGGGGVLSGVEWIVGPVVMAEGGPQVYKPESYSSV